MVFPPHILEIALTGYNLHTGATWANDGEEASQGLQACPPRPGPRLSLPQLLIPRVRKGSRIPLMSHVSEVGTTFP